MANILYITTIDKTIYRFLIPHIKYLIEKGNTVEVACNILEYENKLLEGENIKCNNISFSRNPLSLSNKRAIKEIRNLQNKKKYDLIHVHTPVAAFITRYALKNENVKIVYTCHGFHFYKGAPILNWMIYYPLERIAAKWTDRVITINEEDFERARKFKYRTKNEIYLMHGVGLKKEDYIIENFNRDDYRKSLNIKKEDFMVLVLSELNKNKNHIQMINALEQMRNRKGIKLICAGEGQYFKKLYQYVKERNLEENINFIGFRNDVKELIECSDCVALFSKREGLGKCLLEGMIMKKPLLATKTRGARTIIKEGENGFLVDIGDVNRTSEIVENLRDKNLKLNISDEHREQKVQDYLLENVLKNVSQYNAINKIEKEKNKVVHVTMSGSYGGAENVIFSIIKGLKDKIEFLYLSPRGNIEEFIKERDIKYIPLSLKNLRKDLKEIQSGVIHGHDFMASVLVAIFKGNKKVISHLHTSHKWLEKVSVKSLIYICLSFRFEKIIVVSNAMTKEMWFYKFLKKKIEILINPIDYKEVYYKSESFKIEKSYDVAFIGRLSEYKDPIRFIEIIKMVKVEQKNIKAVLIGGGELKEECLEKIKKYNLEDNIEVLGFLKNPFPIVKNSKIVVAPSKVEALGLAVGEGMLLGKPAICSDICGFREFVNDGNGKLCRKNKEFKDAIIKLLKNEKLYKIKAQNAMELKEHFAFEEYIKRVQRIYSERRAYGK